MQVACVSSYTGPRAHWGRGSKGTSLRGVTMSGRRRHAMSSVCAGLVGVILCAAWPADLNAAMAPSYERIREFGLVMSAGNEAAARLAAHGLIDRIERMDDGTFRFWAKRCFVPVMLEPLPADETPPQPGTPTDYRVVVADVQCQRLETEDGPRP
jgi:hypothetical protein